MKNILLIDFGASRIKSTCLNNYEINFETKGSISYEDKKFHPIPNNLITITINNVLNI